LPDGYEDWALRMKAAENHLGLGLGLPGTPCLFAPCIQRLYYTDAMNEFELVVTLGCIMHRVVFRPVAVHKICCANIILDSWLYDHTITYKQQEILRKHTHKHTHNQKPSAPNGLTTRQHQCI
jgi:hypothetical protein